MNLKPLKLLLVDDDPDFSRFMKIKLSIEAPYLSVDCVHSAAQCMDYLAGKKADCVLSDYQMPDMNGLDLLSALRGSGVDLPFIFVTGQGNEGVARDAFKNGAFDYFTKDITNFAYFTRVVNSINNAIKERGRTEELLRRIAEGVSVESGEAFFNSLVVFLGNLLQADYAFVGEISGGGKNVDILSVCAKGRLGSNFSYSLENTPCENVVGRRVCIYPKNIRKLFPQDELLVKMGIESYAGAPLFDSRGRALGLIVIVDSKPFENADLIALVLTIFSYRTSIELERMRPPKAVGMM